MSSLRSPHAHRPSARRLATWVAGAGLVSAALTGCAATVDPQPAPTDLGSINLGANAEVGEVTVANLLLVTRGEGESARLLGTFANNSDQSVTVIVLDEEDTVTFALGANQTLRLHDEPILLATADDPPGARSTLTISTETTSESIPTPVRDGSLDSLAPYVPDAVESP